MQPSDIYHENISQIKVFGSNKPAKPESLLHFIRNLPKSNQLEFKSEYIKPLVFNLSPMVNVDLGLKIGELKYFIDSYRRYGVAIGLSTNRDNPKNAIVYQVYAGHGDQTMCHLPKKFESLYGNLLESWIDYDTVEVLVGLNGKPNIGQSIKDLYVYKNDVM